MAKVFSEQEYERIRISIFEKGFDLVRENGYKATKVEDVTNAVKISKGTFYKFFISKEEFVAELLIWQHDKFYTHIENEMKKPALSDDVRIHRALMDIAENSGRRFFFLRPAEQQEIKKTLSEEKWVAFKSCELEFYSRIVKLFGKDPEVCKPEVVCNLLMSLLVNIYAPEHIPFSFGNTMKDTVFYQAHMLFHYIVTH